MAEAVSKRTHQSEVFEIGLREAPTTASAGDGKAKAPPQNLVILSFDTASAGCCPLPSAVADPKRSLSVARSGHSKVPKLANATQGESLALPDQELSGGLYMLAEWQSIETANGPALQASKCVRLA